MNNMYFLNKKVKLEVYMGEVTKPPHISDKDPSSWKIQKV